MKQRKYDNGGPFPYYLEAGGGAFSKHVRWYRSDAHALKVWARWQRWMLPKAITRLKVGTLAFAMVRDSKSWRVLKWCHDSACIIRDWDPLAVWQGENPPLKGLDLDKVIDEMEAPFR